MEKEQNWRLANKYGQWRQEIVLSKTQVLKENLDSGIKINVFMTQDIMTSPNIE